MTLGLSLYFPTVENLATVNYLDAIQDGCQLNDLEGSDSIGFGMMLIYCAIALPISVLCGLVGTQVSKLFNSPGVGRYSLAIALILSPLISGTVILAVYGRQC